jgi:hypothetical protein
MTFNSGFAYFSCDQIWQQALLAHTASSRQSPLSCRRIAADWAGDA